MRRIESTKSLETVPPQETVQLRLTCHDEETANAKSVARWGKKWTAARSETSSQETQQPLPLQKGLGYSVLLFSSSV